ncbi:hypothetical protein AB4Z51_41460 [Bradyrhizobium sp. 2TAF36]|uniref:hypothetical protein n=1 Tax=Bradyrhizobium sp. 2TAF36 TaxID=3233016 RepID=UPI003F8DBFDD
MTLMNIQLERLLQNAKLARSDEFSKIAEMYRDLFSRHQFRLRPSVGSISLVSCASATPQLGFSQIKSALHLQNKLAALKEERAKFGDLRRSTPEKRLQSWLISEALQSGGRIASIERALNDGHSYWFVSDEIALAHQTEGNESEKIVADLLLVRENGSGESEFVNAELKYKRTTETHKQVECFWQGFREPEQIALWRKFAETMLGRKERRWKQTEKRRGLVIWPSGSGRAAPRESKIRLDCYKSKGIDTLCYSGPQYWLHAEPSGS